MNNGADAGNKLGKIIREVPEYTLNVVTGKVMRIRDKNTVSSSGWYNSIHLAIPDIPVIPNLFIKGIEALNLVRIMGN